MLKSTHVLCSKYNYKEKHVKALFKRYIKYIQYNTKEHMYKNINYSSDNVPMHVENIHMTYKKIQMTKLFKKIYIIFVSNISNIDK